LSTIVENAKRNWLLFILATRLLENRSSSTQSVTEIETGASKVVPDVAKINGAPNELPEISDVSRLGP